MKLSLNPLNTASIEAQLRECAPASSTFFDQYGPAHKGPFIFHFQYFWSNVLICCRTHVKRYKAFHRKFIIDSMVIK